jgi:hypothetical protein
MDRKNVLHGSCVKEDSSFRTLLVFVVSWIMTHVEDIHGIAYVTLYHAKTVKFVRWDLDGCRIVVSEEDDTSFLR